MANDTRSNPAPPPVEQIAFAFPFRRKGQGGANAATVITDEHDMYRLLKQEPTGAFLVSGKAMWHGGIHVTEAGAGQSLDLKDGVRCIADGEVVAWRLNRTYPISSVPSRNGQPAISATYSTGFALVQHTMEFPRGSKLTFYSLYMHLQDFASCEAEPARAWPAYWPARFEVTQDAVDRPADGAHRRAAPVEQVGLCVRTNRSHGTPVGILPRGTQVTVLKREGDWGQIADDPGALYPPTAGAYVASSAATGKWIFLGTERGHTGPVARRVMPDSSFERVNVVPQGRRVKVKAGDVIGYPGRYDSLRDATPTKKVHIEVFCDGSIKPFINAGRAWIKANLARPDQWNQLGLNPEPTLLRIDRGVTLYQDHGQQGRDAKKTDVIQVRRFAELQRDAGAQWQETTAGPDGARRRWWKVDSADIQRNAIAGWVREQGFAGGRVSREFAQGWTDFECHDEDHDRTHTLFATTGDYVDYASGSDAPGAGSIGKLSPLMADIYRVLYPTGDGAHAAQELQSIGRSPQGRGFPWVAFRASRLIPKHESEWANPDKWQALVSAIEKRTGPKPEHEEERKRIRRLVWWDEVRAGVAGFPGSDVFHIHPIALVGTFFRDRFQFTLQMMQRLFPQAQAPDLQEIIDELNAHLEFYKLDSPLRRTHFFAQILQEAGIGLRLEESFVWSATSLIKTFSYFKVHPAEALVYGYGAVRPIKADGTRMGRADFEAIANRAYGHKRDLGNGSPESGDGWKYRGRGMKQLTGRANYREFTEWQASHQAEFEGDVHDYEDNPDLLAQPKYAARSAAFFWVSNNLPELADRGAAHSEVDKITEVVNSFTDSYGSRVKNFELIWSRGDFR